MSSGDVLFCPEEGALGSVDALKAEPGGGELMQWVLSELSTLISAVSLK